MKSLLEEYSENIEAITLLGNGNVKMQKVSEELSQLKQADEEKDKLIKDLYKLVEYQKNELSEMKKDFNDKWTKLVKEGIFED